MAMHTIVALFDDYRDAEGAIRELESMGVPSTDINLIANNAGNRYGEYPQYGIDRGAHGRDAFVDCRFAPHHPEAAPAES